MTNEKCTVCGGDIVTMAYRMSPWCSADCKKKSGMDVSSLGTFMFVTTEEAFEINRARSMPNTKLGIMKDFGKLDIGKLNREAPLDGKG